MAKRTYTGLIAKQLSYKQKADIATITGVYPVTFYPCYPSPFQHKAIDEDGTAHFLPAHPLTKVLRF